MNKKICRIFGSLLTLLLSGCSKTTINMNCVPPLYYELNEDSSVLILGETTNSSIFKTLSKYGLKTTQGRIQTYGSYIAPSIKKIENKSQRLRLLGPVFFHKKAPYDPFGGSRTSAYVDYNGEQLWVSLNGFYFIGLEIPTENNVANNNKLGIPTTITNTTYFNALDWKCSNVSESKND